MLAYIKGRVAAMDEESLVLENGGIGYRILAPVPALNSLSKGQEARLYTHLQVREDAMVLYGFLSQDDLALFKLLIGVNGIGPKGAMGILSAVPADELRFAVLSEDTKAICRAPGIGVKTARKLILELKDRLSLEEAFEAASAPGGAVSPGQTADNRGEAVQALTALGYSGAEALRAVNAVEGGESMDTEALLKAALKSMMLF